MKLIDYILLPCLMSGALFAGHEAVYAAPASIFPEKSVLAEGKWVKIYIDKTGVYELTDAELAAMGFSDPAAIGVYGRGGGLQPTQFVNPDGDSYVSDLQPVAIYRREGKTYFFAQGNQKVRYCKENDSRKDAKRFERESNQVYADDVAYFITDTPPQRSFAEQVSEGEDSSSLPALTEAWAYSYHEVDRFTAVSSGREFFGESFAGSASREQSFAYDIPGAVVGSDACVTAVFAVRSSSASQLEYGFGGGAEGATSTGSIPACSQYDNYKYATLTYVTAPVPGSKGEVVFRFTPSEDDVSFAALDYFVVGARRQICFQDGESQFAVYPYEFNSRKYSRIELPGVSPSYGVWQVSGPGSVKLLGCSVQDDKTRVLWLDDNHDGPLVFVDYAKEQYRVKGYEPVANQNLHALGTRTVPSMLIITLPALKPAADRLAALHKEREGIDVAVVLHSDVVNEFSAGVDDPMAYRALAKMLYDRDDAGNRVFKNILLLGPNVRDHRNILGIVPEIGTLISNQTYTASSTDYSYCMNDWYGMMDDMTAYEQNSALYFRNVPMHLGVGIIPVRSLAEADAVVDKVTRFYDDDSFAYWLASFNYVADGGDNNEHQNWQEELWRSMDVSTSSSVLGTKIYNNLCVDFGSRDLLVSKVNEGSLLSFYTGHATSETMGSYLLEPGSEHLFKNNRYGMAFFGACDVSPFDSNKDGMGTRLFTMPYTGFIAVLGSSRSGYSRHNFTLLHTMQRFMLLDDINDATKPLSSPRTLGEIYALSKSAVTNHSNKFVFHLLGDPAVVLPLPTADVRATLIGTTADNVYPGSEIHIEGSVTDRNGQRLDSFNGTVVARLCAPAIVRMTGTRQGSPSVPVSLDQSPLLTTAFVVKDGKFRGAMLVPTNTPEALESDTVMLRFTAYDHSTRTGAAGALPMHVPEYDKSQAVTSDLPPVIEAMYADSPDVSEYDLVPPSFTLHADITDDHGVMAYDVNGIPSLYMSIDGRDTRFDLSGHVTLGQGGKRLHLAYPVNDLADGKHLLSLTASDADGKAVTRTLAVNVGGDQPSSPLGTAAPGPYRDNVHFIVGDADPSRTDILRVVDATGRLVFTAPMKDGELVWDLKDNEGVRVPEGVYYGICVQRIPGKGAAVTDFCEIVIMN